MNICQGYGIFTSTSNFGWQILCYLYENAIISCADENGEYGNCITSTYLHNPGRESHCMKMVAMVAKDFLHQLQTLDDRSYATTLHWYENPIISCADEYVPGITEFIRMTAENFNNIISILAGTSPACMLFKTTGHWSGYTGEAPIQMMWIPVEQIKQWFLKLFLRDVPTDT